ncbi:neutral/alkaline non-lysosomal ceramidase N-terminal domain-containing protein [Segetibacter koreensis]|uniref:neutral/alkaline non-lysosomal ceramidase N-terminal domain-containing protein n=1 Tax=Segetibacter koreensis TaxID=398037 RepID=UPI00035D3203|nr:neutral/alkaline non-lysosomal ceramidase N-terminal domain-containing protein [Segetibacter koreensis]
MKFQKSFRAYCYCLVFISVLLFSKISLGQKADAAQTMDIGVARVDITPEGPIRLAGYGARPKSESTGVLQRLSAKAIAFGSDAQHPSILITVDLVGIPARITQELVEQISKKAGIEPAQIAICASHTHGGPEVGNLLNILQYRGENFSDSLLNLEQLVHIAKYTEQLSQKLQEVTFAALKGRKPAFVAWGQGQAGFAANRRTKDGPVDPSLPFMRITNPDGTLRAVFVNYACHGTTLDGDVNEVHGDWIGEAQRAIEERHPGVIAMIALGCGADANPQPRGNMEDVQQHGKEIADNVDKLLKAQLQILSEPPAGNMKWIKLPFSKVPTVPELIQLTQDKTVKGYYARLALDRIQRGQAIPSELNYPVQVWNFGNKLAMVNLAGEVVVDYSTRLKNELGAEHLWINGYSNDVPCYIASRRVIQEGGYEAESSMYYYDKPSPFALEVEDIIVKSVHDLMPASFKEERDTVNDRKLVKAGTDGTLYLDAAMAEAIGSNIKYMPEWKAFGWFTTDDKTEWDVEVGKKGKYNVYLDWAVSDAEAGKSFVFEGGDKKLKGKIGKTGSWFTYKKEKIGTIQLPAGPHKMVFRSNSDSAKGAMLDLRRIVLVPVK